MEADSRSFSSSWELDSSSNRILFKSSNIYQSRAKLVFCCYSGGFWVFFYVEEGKLVDFSREMADFLMVLACYCFYFEQGKPVDYFSSLENFYFCCLNGCYMLSFFFMFWSSSRGCCGGADGGYT